MGLLARTGLSALACVAACYAPDTRDCTLKCTSSDDCAGDQSCSSDGYCVAMADTHCTTGSGSGAMPTTPTTPVMHDAGIPVVMADAAIDAAPDAPTRGRISVSIEGKGVVVLDGIATCASGSSQCDYEVLLDLPITMHAIADDDFEFDKWTTSPCVDEREATCAFVPTLDLVIVAKFRRDH